MIFGQQYRKSNGIMYNSTHLSKQSVLGCVGVMKTTDANEVNENWDKQRAVKILKKDNKIKKWRLKTFKHTVRAILSNPAGNALAGAIDGVAGAVVAAEADLGAGPPVPATWTDCTKTEAKYQNNNPACGHWLASVSITTLNLDIYMTI